MRNKRGGKENVDDGGGMLEDEDAGKNDVYKNRDEEDEDESYEGEKRRGGEPRGQRRRRGHQKNLFLVDFFQCVKMRIKLREKRENENKSPNRKKT